MEQQNQQPLQQEQPNSPSIRKSFVNPKLPLVIALVATTLTVGGILLLKTFQSSPTLPSAPTSTQLTTGEEVKTQGVVRANNQGCEIDADCFIVLKEPKTDKEIRVIYQPGWTVCAERDVLPNSNPYTIQVGDEVEVYGKVTSENFISICESAAYYIRRLTKESDVDTNTWQTYRNKEFGFEVKYPPDWSVSDNAGISLGKNSLDVAIIVWNDGSKEYAEAQWQSVPCAPYGDGGCAPLGNKETKIIEVNGNTVYWKIDGYNQIHVFIPNQQENKTVEMYTVHLQNKGLFDQILSTFRFVEK